MKRGILKSGDRPPSFALPSLDGKTVALADYGGRRLTRQRVAAQREPQGTQSEALSSQLHSVMELARCAISA